MIIFCVINERKNISLVRICTTETRLFLQAKYQGVPNGNKIDVFHEILLIYFNEKLVLLIYSNVTSVSSTVFKV